MNKISEAYRGHNVEGDMSVSHDLHIGGKSIMHGKTTFKSDVRIDGVLEADNINVANKGLFSSEFLLRQTHPNPQSGWWAIVGDGIPGIIYRVENRQWYNTGIVGGDINGSGNDTEFQEHVEDELTLLKNAVFPINLSLKHNLTSSPIEFTGEDRPVTLSWSCSRQGNSIIPKSMSVVRIANGRAETIQTSCPGTSSGKTETSVNTLGITKFQCSIITDDGITKTSAIQIQQVLPVYYGFAYAISSLDDMQNLRKLTDDFPAAIITDITNDSGNNRLFICTPQNVTVKTVTSSGFGVPMADAVTLPVTIGENAYTYNIYKSANVIQPNTYDIQISIT